MIERVVTQNRTRGTLDGIGPAALTSRETLIAPLLSLLVLIEKTPVTRNEYL